MDEEKLIKLVCKFENFSLKDFLVKFFRRTYYGYFIKLYLFNRSLKKYKYVIVKDSISNPSSLNKNRCMCKRIWENGFERIEFINNYTNYNFILISKEKNNKTNHAGAAWEYYYYFKDKEEAARFNLEH